jgi:type I restriction enzyme S subunit
MYFIKAIDICGDDGMLKPFDEVFEDRTKYGTKIKTDDYHSSGAHIIIDQGQEQIAGYTNLEEGLFTEVPAIIFGDHTRIIKYVDRPFFLGADGVKVLRCRYKDANYKYLYYALKSVHIPNTGYNRHFKWLKEATIFYPDRKTQAKIVETLEKASVIIEKRQQQLSALDDLIKARFVEMFGDETNPYQWPVVNVEDVANVSVGVVIKPAQHYTDAEHGVKAFRSLNIGAGTIKDSDWVYFSHEGNDKNAKSQLRENDLLVVRSGSPGTACVVPKIYEGCNAIDIIIARPEIDKVNPHYLCTYTNLPHGKRQIDEGTGGAAQQHFNVGKYNKLQLMLPPLKQQNEFVNFLEQIDKSKSVIQKSLDETQLLFDSLMQKYFG